MAVDAGEIFLTAQHGEVKQTDGIVAVLGVLEHRQQGAVGAVGGGGVFDGFDDERLDDLDVVVPVDADVLQSVLERLVAADEAAEDGTPEVTIHLVRVRLGPQILGVDLGAEDEVEDALDEVRLVGPRNAMLLDVSLQR